MFGRLSLLQGYTVCALQMLRPMLPLEPQAKTRPAPLATFEAASTLLDTDLRWDRMAERDRYTLSHACACTFISSATDPRLNQIKHCPSSLQASLPVKPFNAFQQIVEWAGQCQCVPSCVSLSLQSIQVHCQQSTLRCLIGHAGSTADNAPELIIGSRIHGPKL